MTRDECKKIVMVIDAVYPNFKAEDLTGTINAWYVMLEDYDYNAIQTGLKVFIATSGSAFAPSVSELIAASRKVQELQEPDAIESWSQVRKAIRRGIYYAEQDFEELSEIAKKVVGSPSQIRSWAQMESREIDSVVASNFKRNYETVQNRNRDLQAIPGNVLQMIETVKETSGEKYIT